MPIESKDRPIHKVREDVIDLLIFNYGHEKLSLEAFERRLDQALESQDPVELDELTADLDKNIDTAYVQQKKQQLGSNLDVDDDDIDYMFNIFGGSNSSGSWRVPKEIRMFNLFGGATLDFSEAEFNQNTSYIRIYSLFGGATLFVNDNMKINTRMINIFGGDTNKALPGVSRSGPTIIISGVSIFSGNTIKTKTTVKESLLKFAESFKSVFQTKKNR